MSQDELKGQISFLDNNPVDYIFEQDHDSGATSVRFGDVVFSLSIPDPAKSGQFDRIALPLDSLSGNFKETAFNILLKALCNDHVTREGKPADSNFPYFPVSVDPRRRSAGSPVRSIWARRL